MAVTSRTELIDYALRELGDPVIEINVDDQQIEDRVDDALQLFAEQHFDGVEKVFLKHTITQPDIDNEYIDVPNPVLSVIRVIPVNSGFSGDIFNEEYQFFLNVSRNVGFNFKYFFTEEDALDWLSARD